MLDLIPGVSRNLWRDNDPKAEAADAEYRAKRPTILARQQHTCQYCGVQSRNAMEVHHGDCNHANNADDNLKLADVFCHPVNHIGELAHRFTRADQSEIAGGVVRLAYLPDISQADLSHLLRTIGHVLNTGTDEQKADAEALYHQLLAYSRYVEAAWTTSDAKHFAIAMRESSHQAYASRGVTMAGIRVFFSLEAVKKLAARFANEFIPLPLTAWLSIYQQRKPQSSQAT